MDDKSLIDGVFSIHNPRVSFPKRDKRQNWPIYAAAAGMIGMVLLLFTLGKSTPVASVTYLERKPITRSVKPPVPEIVERNKTPQPIRFRVEPVNQVIISASRMGVIVGRSKIDSVVTFGDVVVQLDDSTAQAELVLARHVSVKMATLTSQLAMTRLETAMRSNAAGAKRGVANIVSELELKTLELKSQFADSDAVKSSLDVKRLEAVVGTYRSVSPFDGIVTEVFREAGETTREGEAILEITDTESMRAIGYWQVDTAPSLGDSVDINIANTTVVGRVSHVSRRIEPLTNEVEVWIDLPRGGYREGQVATINTDGL